MIRWPKPRFDDAWLVGGTLVATAGALAWFWSRSSWVSVWPVMAGVLALAASVVVLVWLVPGRWQSLAWGAVGGALLAAETLWRALDLPEAGRVFQAVAWSAAVLLTGVSGYCSAAGWQAGLRAGVAGQVVATLGWALVLGAGLGDPVMAAALDIGGSLERFAHTPALVFWTWVIEDFWGGTALRLVLACGWGAALGWAGGKLGTRVRFRKASSRLRS